MRGTEVEKRACLLIRGGVSIAALIARLHPPQTGTFLLKMGDIRLLGPIGRLRRSHHRKQNLCGIATDYLQVHGELELVLAPIGHRHLFLWLVPFLKYRH